MNTQQLFVFGACMLVAALGGGAIAQQESGKYVQVAEIEVDPTQSARLTASESEQPEHQIHRVQRLFNDRVHERCERHCCVV